MIYSPQINKRCRKHLRSTNDSWKVDETYIKVSGESKYLYRAIVPRLSVERTAH
jgi:transposase, IS6 family